MNLRGGKLIQQQWLVFKSCLFKSARIRNNLIDVWTVFFICWGQLQLVKCYFWGGIVMTIRWHNNTLVWKTKDRKSLVYRASQLTALGTKCDIHELILDVVNLCFTTVNTDCTETLPNETVLKYVQLNGSRFTFFLVWRKFSLEVDSSIPLTHHDPRDLGLICPVEKRRTHFPILSD